MNTPYVLMVEDNLIATRLQKILLEKLNCNVDSTITGEEALEMTKKTKYDLILMDIGLPGMDGIQTCEAIRRHEKETGKKSVPMVAVSSNVDPKQLELCKNAGMLDAIIKPLTLDKAQHILSLL